VYTFPLPNDAAVDDMTMRIGDRVVKGQIKRREEAREILRGGQGLGPGRRPARPGAAQHLHPGRRERDARPKRRGRHLLRPSAQVRREQV
jgi:hypothetical protein